VSAKREHELVMKAESGEITVEVSHTTLVMFIRCVVTQNMVVKLAEFAIGAEKRMLRINASLKPNMPPVMMETLVSGVATDFDMIVVLYAQCVVIFEMESTNIESCMQRLL